MDSQGTRRLVPRRYGAHRLHRRDATAAGADGPANLLDAAVVAAHHAAADPGVVVSFAGGLHAACTVRELDSTGAAAFGSPMLRAIARVDEGRFRLHARPDRRAPLPVTWTDTSSCC